MMETTMALPKPECMRANCRIRMPDSTKKMDEQRETLPSLASLTPGKKESTHM